MLLRLGLATAFVLSLCVGLLWLARRQGARVAAKSGSRLQLVDTLSLGNQSYLYRLRVDDEEFVVGVNRVGLQSLQRLEPSFEATFEALATGEEQPSIAPPRPAA
jgi:flagellar biogenesis protein FliO